MNRFIDKKRIAIVLLICVWVLTLGLFGLVQNSWERERRFFVSYQQSNSNEILELRVALNDERRRQKRKVEGLSSKIESLNLEIQKNNRRIESITNQYKYEKDRADKLTRELGTLTAKMKELSGDNQSGKDELTSGP